MRFSNKNYLKAFPREAMERTKVTVKEEDHGSVIEEAEKIGKEPEHVSEPDPDELQGDPGDEGDGGDD